MNQFLLQQETSIELQLFPNIVEFALKKNNVLFPFDVAMILPGQKIGGRKDFLDIGTLSWINIKIEKLEPTGKLVPGPWSSLSKNECLAIGKVFLLNSSLVLSKLKEAGTILQELRHELLSQQIGYRTRVNQLVDELFLLIARKL